MCTDKFKFNPWCAWLWKVHRRDCMLVKWSVTTLVLYFNDACYFCQFITNCIDNNSFRRRIFPRRSLQPFPLSFSIPAYCLMFIWFDQLLLLEETSILRTQVEDRGALLHGKQFGLNNVLWLEFVFTSRIKEKCSYLCRHFSPLHPFWRSLQLHIEHKTVTYTEDGRKRRNHSLRYQIRWVKPTSKQFLSNFVKFSFASIEVLMNVKSASGKRNKPPAWSLRDFESWECSKKFLS